MWIIQRLAVCSVFFMVATAGGVQSRAQQPPEKKPQMAPPAAARPAAPPRLTPLEPEERPGVSTEDDLLDIPAFLRRQAN